MGLFANTMIGGLAGGVLGGMSEGGSFTGGAIGGAAVGFGGGWAASRMSGGRSLAQLAQSGLGYGASGAGALRGVAPKLLSNSGYGNAAVRYGMAGLGAASRGMARGASGLIGNTATQINKWGGRALMGAGVASGAHIGSSIIGSNRGY